MREDLKKLHGVALVTGSAKRIGRAIALELANCGLGVVAHYHRSGEETLTLINDIEKLGGKGACLRADLSIEKEVVNLVERAAEKFGPITCLINNASVFEEDTPMTQSSAIWDNHMQTNLRAPFLLSQQFAKQIPSNAKGNIINIIDQRVWNLTPDFTSYTLSKFALWGMTQILARAFAPSLRVNAVGPGPTLKNIHQTNRDFKKEWQAVPLEAPVSLGDICNAIRFILYSPSMTGQMVALDGGQHMGWSPERKSEF